MVGCPCVVIARHLDADDLRESFEHELAQHLCASGMQVLLTPHLYHIPHGSDLWSQIASLGDPLVVTGWINSRPLECLVREYAGRESRLTLNLNDFDSAQAAHSAIMAAVRPVKGAGAIQELHADTPPRWYPVIDRTRCTSCRHCLQFCLFGVYESLERRVVAVSPDSCKDGCPACARVCPEGAIIFPLSDEPAIAGAPGAIMQPDAAARRMYYVRTGRKCPLCGEVAEAGAIGAAPEGVEVCDECGAPLREQPAAETSAVHAEIDSLIDALDDLVAGGGGE